MSAAIDASEGRIFSFTATTANKNRNGWRIERDAWLLDSFRANPVVLWAHDDESLPLGRALEVAEGAGETLRARVEFVPKGLVEFVDLVVEYLRQRFLRGMSVGFIPLDWRWDELPDKTRELVFLAAELVELSILPVPADAAALAQDATSMARLSIDPHATIAILRRKVAIAELGACPSDWAFAVLLARRAILQATGLSGDQKHALQQAVWRLELRLRAAGTSQ